MILATTQVLLAEGATPVLHLIARLQRLAVEATVARETVQDLSKPTYVFPLIITSYVSSCRVAVVAECQANTDLLILVGMTIC